MSNYPYENLLAKSGKPKEYLNNYRASVLARKKAILLYAETLGAVRAYDNGEYTGFRFERNKIPKGWKKPTRRGVSYPYANNFEAKKEINNLPQSPPKEDIFAALNLPHNVRWKKDESSGSYPMGDDYSFFNMYAPGWWSATSPVVLVRAPNLEFERRKCEVEGQEFTFDHDEFMDGFEVVSTAQVEFWFAEAKLVDKAA